ncbi:hypothetical protein AALP_AA8G328600 [Arabis alpina]|uniref:Uncharacterized protein n=1 Tax=Arabis alpina TaxID=50452 RepID=A0A087GB03_ARAAL|nr:hypothetical protein AALP_AA8G328600 [Arabis alpina]
MNPSDNCGDMNPSDNCGDHGFVCFYETCVCSVIVVVL